MSKSAREKLSHTITNIGMSIKNAAAMVAILVDAIVNVCAISQMTTPLMLLNGRTHQTIMMSATAFSSKTALKYLFLLLLFLQVVVEMKQIAVVLMFLPSKGQS